MSQQDKLRPYISYVNWNMQTNSQFYHENIYTLQTPMVMLETENSEWNQKPIIPLTFNIDLHIQQEHSEISREMREKIAVKLLS